ncbi:MAG: MBL fold metallo-hydrolase [Betaproteobacteria bacterium]|nr:MBL fold metallo-hydrolase [Betaproteobacteria bacterium]
MNIRFLGAAREVTGSSYWLDTGDARLLVDCGMFQGGREARQRNFSALDFDARTLDAVVQTHAHIDHSGLLPRLVLRGFKGPIFCTEPTAALLKVMLLDSAFIQEKEAEWQNFKAPDRRGAGRGRKVAEAAPLYTVAQAQASLKQLRPLPYDQPFEPTPGVRCIFRDAGHILGSAIIECWVRNGGTERKIVFSGDLGQPGHPLVRDPTLIPEADYLLVESTYGNRLHRSWQDTVEEFVAALQDTLRQRQGNVIIPAFAVGRTQDILFLLAELTRQGRLKPLDIYVDSPMATAATEVLFRHLDVLDAEAHRVLDWEGRAEFFARVRFVQDVEESRALNRIKGGAIIISASGMCEAGRIKHHLRHNLPRPESTVIIVGFQAANTLGRRLVDKARLVRIFREDVPVRAHIYTIGGLSAHADQAGLLAWLKGFRRPPRQTFVVHGESATALEFGEKLRQDLGWNATVPEAGQSFELD